MIKPLNGYTMFFLPDEITGLAVSLVHHLSLVRKLHWYEFLVDMFSNPSESKTRVEDQLNK